MVKNTELQDKIRVEVKVEKFKFPKVKYFSDLFSDVENKINNKLEKAKKEIAPNVGRRLADLNQLSQKTAISTLDAVRDGNLLGSITVRGGRGSTTVTYEVGTNISDIYPHYVVYGRGGATARNAKVIRFSPKHSTEILFRKSVGPASPRNYPQVAHSYFEPQISAIVYEEVQRVLGD